MLASQLQVGLAIGGIASLIQMAAAELPIIVPSTITVGTETTITLTPTFFGLDGSATPPEVRIYLALSPAQGNAHEGDWVDACYLVNATSSSVASINITVPASAAPDGAAARIGVARTTSEPVPNPDNDPNMPVSSTSYWYSGTTTLQGGNAVWSDPELGGFEKIGSADQIPCSEYNCARVCGVKFYEKDFDGQNLEALRPVYECTASCPGVTMKSWAELTGQSGNNTSASASSQQSASTTASVSGTGAAISSTAAATPAVEAAASSSTVAPSTSASTVLTNGEEIASSVWKMALSFLGVLFVL